MFEEQENTVVLNENSVDRKPCIHRIGKSDELTIKLYSCHDINMKFLVVVTPPSIYQVRRQVIAYWNINILCNNVSVDCCVCLPSILYFVNMKFLGVVTPPSIYQVRRQVIAYWNINMLCNNVSVH